MKLLGLILIMIFSVSLGFIASQNQIKILNYAKSSYQMLCRLKMLIRYSQPEKQELHPIECRTHRKKIG